LAQQYGLEHKASIDMGWAWAVCDKSEESRDEISRSQTVFPGTWNIERRTSNAEHRMKFPDLLPMNPALTPALSHPMGEGEAAPAREGGN